MDGREHVVLDGFSLGYCLLATVGEERYGDVRMYPPFPCIFLIAFTLQSLHLCGGRGLILHFCKKSIASLSAR